MSNCCSASDTRKQGNKRVCPVSGKECLVVPFTTIIHHLSKPWTWEDAGESYYFCDDHDCKVVYFSESNKVITEDQLRMPVGQKDPSEVAMLCYCFGVTRGDYLKDKGTKAYVLDQTKKQACACEVRNPSGRCCLKGFPKSDS